MMINYLFYINILLLICKYHPCNNTHKATGVIMNKATVTMNKATGVVMRS